ncbi:MAG: PAS domain S-box protein, partial [Gallionella sp.]
MMAPTRKKPLLARLTPAGVALLYAAFAAVWIAASGYLLTLAISDPLLHSRIELIKGLLFVAVTGMLLYLLLKGWSERLYADRPASDAPTVPTDGTAPHMASRLVLVFIALVLIVPLIGLTIVKIHIPQAEQEAYRNLEAVTRLKAEQIENWLDERRGNGEVLASDHAFAARVRQFVRQDEDAESSKLILDRFEHLLANYHYTKILLLDANGQLLLSAGEDVTAAPALPSLLREALDSKQVQRRDIYRDEEGHIHLEWAVPLVVSEAQGERAVAVVVLRVTAQRFIFPLIQSWPTASTSGETLLVRRDGESVLFINELRHRKGIPLTIREPISRLESPPAVAIRANQPGTVRGKGYRGVEVLAAYRPVAGTDWHIVAKIDRDEILAPMWDMVYWIGLIVFIAVTAIIATLLLLWRQQQRAQRLALAARLAAATEESEEKLRKITESAQDAIIMMGADRRISFWNAAAERVFGYTAAEAIGQELHALIAPVPARAGFAQAFPHFQNTGEGPIIGAVREVTALRKNGEEFPAELSVSATQIDGKWHAIGIVRDITMRKTNEARIQRLTQLYAALSQCNQAIVRCTDEAELFPQICRDAVQFGGMKMAWVGLLDPVAQTIRQVASFGEGAGQLQGLEIPVDAASPFGRGSTGAAIRENRPYWCQDFRHDPLCAPWNESGARPDWAASAALPLRRDGSVVGAFTLYAAEPNAFDEDARNLLVEMATDISFALDNFAHEARRERAENEARLLTQRITLATEAASIGIWDWHLQTDHWYATPTYFTMLGYAPEEGILDRAVWIERVHPEDRDAVAKKIQAVLAGSDTSYQYEARLRHADGSYRWVSVIGRVAERDGNGKAIRMLGVRMDITGRKQAEDSLLKLSLAVEQSPNSIIITDLKANIEYANAAFVKTTGYSLPEVVGKNPRILHSGKTPRATYDDLWAHLTRGEMWKGEFINRRKDGSEYIEAVLFSPVRQPDGRVTHYMAIKEDITEFKRAQEAIYRLNEELEDKVAARTAELDKARLEAEQANRSKSDFLAAMSHEIRTPMNGVVGMIDVLQQSSLTGPQMEMANIIHDSAFSLLVVINDILDFSKIEAGKLQIEIAPMDVAGVVDGACESLYQMSLKKGVELTLFTDPAIPASVMGDAGRLRQILVNLAGNAIKFSSGQDRPGKISVRTVLVESTPDGQSLPLPNPPPQAGEGTNESLRDAKQILLEFRVTDNGIGIDEATQARLFTPFTQADTSTTRAYGGTGLGLVISRQLAHIMGGEIEVHSEPGKGSLFCMRVPFDLPQEQPPADESPSVVAGLTCLVAGGKKSLADDLAVYLAHDGAEVERAEDMAAVREWIDSRPPGLCVVVIDTEGISPLPEASLTDELRAAARTRPGADARFVAIERGGRRRCRVVATDLVNLDAEVMHRRVFLETVAIAAGRIKQAAPEEKHGDASVKPRLSREEARRRGSLILVAEDNE